DADVPRTQVDLWGAGGDGRGPHEAHQQRSGMAAGSAVANSLRRHRVVPRPCAWACGGPPDGAAGACGSQSPDHGDGRGKDSRLQRTAPRGGQDRSDLSGHDDGARGRACHVCAVSRGDRRRLAVHLGARCGIVLGTDAGRVLELGPPATYGHHQSRSVSATTHVDRERLGGVSQLPERTHGAMGNEDRGAQGQVRRDRGPCTQDVRDPVRDLAGRHDVPLGTQCGSQASREECDPDVAAPSIPSGVGCPTATIANRAAAPDEPFVGDAVLTNATPPTDSATAPKSANSRSRQHDTTAWTANAWRTAAGLMAAKPTEKESRLVRGSSLCWTLAPLRSQPCAPCARCTEFYLNCGETYDTQSRDILTRR